MDKELQKNNYKDQQKKIECCLTCVNGSSGCEWDIECKLIQTKWEGELGYGIHYQSVDILGICEKYKQSENYI